MTGIVRESGLTATFIGGCVAASEAEENLAYEAGRRIGEYGFDFQHGGYNGLMEHAARGAADSAARVIAVTIRGKEAWGPVNKYVGQTLRVRDMGERLAQLLGRSDLVIAMGGGVGTLHELTAALWYAGNIRRIPVIATGPSANRLIAFLRDERWLYESPTRPLDFLHIAIAAPELRAILQRLVPLLKETDSADRLLMKRVVATGTVQGPYRLETGGILAEYFDPFRLAVDPQLCHELSLAMAELVTDQADVVAGVALGGVKLAADMAAALGLPMIIARTRPKQYGTRARLEGALRPGQQAVIVDDVVRTGENMLRTARYLSARGVVVRQALCVIERPGRGRSALQDRGIPLLAMAALDDSGASHPSSSGNTRVAAC